MKNIIPIFCITIIIFGCGGGGGSSSSSGGSSSSSTGDNNSPSIDTTPIAFAFTDQSNVKRSALITSSSITVTGINAASAISVTNGEYSIAGGAYTSLAGTVTNGQTVTVQHTSSSSLNANINTTLTIGTISDTFTSTTTNTNNSPIITNTPINYSVIENQLSAFTVSVSDSDNDVISFALSGVDSSKLNIDSSGAITFKSVPDYEAPTDSGSNNIIREIIFCISLTLPGQG